MKRRVITILSITILQYTKLGYLEPKDKWKSQGGNPT